MEKVIGERAKILEYLLINRNNDIKYELSEFKEKRSLNANAYFHLLCNKLAKKLNKSNEDMKIELNLSYGTIARAEDGKKMGCMIPKYVNIRDFYEYAYCYKEDEQYSYYLFYKRTSELNSKEFSDLLNGTVSECKQQGIETLEDKEINKLLEEMDK